MGTERTRKRQHLFLYIACLVTITFVVPGCLHLPKKWQGEEHLSKARCLMVRGDFAGALKENKRVLKQFPRSLADQALFQIGQIYAHPKNPNTDYQKSLKSFQKIVYAFPESRLREEAQIWVLFIREIVEKEKNIHMLQDQIEKLKRIDLGVEEKKSKALPQNRDTEE